LPTASVTHFLVKLFLAAPASFFSVAEVLQDFLASLSHFFKSWSGRHRRVSFQSLGFAGRRLRLCDGSDETQQGSEGEHSHGYPL